MTCAKLLLSHGADPNAKDASDLTPLSIAIRRKANDIVGETVTHAISSVCEERENSSFMVTEDACLYDFRAVIEARGQIGRD